VPQITADEGKIILVISAEPGILPENLPAYWILVEFWY
jgi:hypothetical protein